MNTENFKKFIQNIKCFEPHYFFDPSWYFICSNGKSKWYYLLVSFYKDVYYISDIISKNSIEIKKDGTLNTEDNHNVLDVQFWNSTINYANEYAELVKKDWLKAYELLNKNYPYKYRRGTLQYGVASAYCKDLFNISKMLGQKKTKAFLSLIESRKLDDYKVGNVADMTAQKYFGYCRVAYLHSNIKMDAATKKITGRAMYKLYADGRHEGLLDIKQNSVEEFAQWIKGKHPKRVTGGHPWEILRGGNTTKISLSVELESDTEGNIYKVSLRGDAIHRLAEFISILLGLVAANLPIAINKPKELRSRILEQDNIGIVPDYEYLHRANQNFDEDINDVMHLHNFGRNKSKVLGLISWKGLPCLKTN